MKREIHPDAQVIADYYAGKIDKIQVRGDEETWWTTTSVPNANPHSRYRAKPVPPEPVVGDLVYLECNNGKYVGIYDGPSGDPQLPYRAGDSKWAAACVHPKQKQLDIYHDALRAIVSHACQWSSGVASMAIEEAELTKKL